jgi:hypothetical protein
MTPELWTAILGIGGLAAIIPKIIDGLLAWRSGRAVSEKKRNQSVLERLADAERREQAESDFRRKLEEYAGALRLLLIQAGVPPDRIPPWPVRESRRPS